MGRWAYLDSDEERLPEGMTRVGYDADEGVYTYRDADGSSWQGVPGSRYGPMFRVKKPSYSSQPSPARPAYAESSNVWNNLDPTGQNNNANNVKDWLDADSDSNSTIIEDALNNEKQPEANEKLQAVNEWATKPISSTYQKASVSSDQSDEDDDSQVNHKKDIDTEFIENFPEDQVRRRNRYLERQKGIQKQQGLGGGFLRLGRLIEDMVPLIASSKSGLSRMSTVRIGSSRRQNAASSTSKGRRNTLS